MIKLPKVFYIIKDGLVQQLIVSEDNRREFCIDFDSKDSFLLWRFYFCYKTRNDAENSFIQIKENPMIT